MEHVPEGLYLATSDDVQGLVAQGRTIQETIEIARDVAKKLIEAQTGTPPLPPAREAFDYPLIVATCAILKQAGIEAETFLAKK